MRTSTFHLLGPLSWCLLAGCAPRAHLVHPPDTPWAWDDRPLDPTADAGPVPPEEVSVFARLVRLDRAIDLFDAARFTGSTGLREQLWSRLGGHPSGRGAAATTDALSRLLDEALALDEATRDAPPPGWSDAAQTFVADAIALISNDLALPRRAEDLSIRALAYRELAERGHPRIADNARWRQYDHVRATLRRAVEAPPEQRWDVAVHALYVDHERITAWLADVPEHDKPAYPEPTALLDAMASPLRILSEMPRWAVTVAELRGSDLALHDAVLATLPAIRDASWPVPQVRPGTGRSESWAPVVLLRDGAVEVDAGRLGQQIVPLEDDVTALAGALSATLARDGRGTLLLGVEPRTPAPELHRLLRAIRRAQSARVELALQEARGAGGPPAFSALDVEVIRSADATPGANGLLRSRVAVHLSGRGPEFFIDGRSLSIPTTPEDARALAERIARAYPRETIVRLTLAADVAYPQLIDLATALRGGTSPSFAALGWWAGGVPPDGVPEADGSDALARRLALRFAQPRRTLEIDDGSLDDALRGRIEDYGTRLLACLPDLERPLARGQARIAVRFDEEGRARAQLVDRRDRPLPTTPAWDRCTEEEAWGLRAQGVIPRVTITLSDVAAG